MLIGQKNIRISALGLILANTFPLVGVGVWGWSLFDVLLVYWLESLVVGIFCIFKSFFALPFSKAVVFDIFFFGHFGLFLLGHSLFLRYFFEEDGLTNNGFVINAGYVADLTALVVGRGLVVGFVVLFISHLISFLVNFLRQKEYLKVDIGSLMWQPYKRVFIMQFVLIFGGIFYLALGLRHEVFLLALIGVKILFDLRAHLSEHRN